MNNENQNPAFAAALTYMRRNNGLETPMGYFSGAVWVPALEEIASCCLDISIPKTAWLKARALARHTLSMKHIARRFRADEREAWKFVKAFKAGLLDYRR